MKTADTSTALVLREQSPPSGTAAIAAGGLPFELLLRPGASETPEHALQDEVAVDERAEAEAVVAAVVVATQPLPVDLSVDIGAINAEAPQPAVEAAAAGAAAGAAMEVVAENDPAMEHEDAPVTGGAERPMPAVGEPPAVAAGKEPAKHPPADERPQVDTVANDTSREPPAANADSARQPEQAVIPAEVQVPAPSPVTPAVNIAPLAPTGQTAFPTGAAHEQAAPRGGVPVEIDSPRLLSRVARAFHIAQQRGRELTLRLSPPELGSVRLELRIEEGALTARLETETEVARSALIEDLPALRERLAEQGVRVERFDVDLMQQRGQEPGGREQRPESERGGVGEWESGRPAIRRVDDNLPLTPSPSHPLSTTSGLNVLI